MRAAETAAYFTPAPAAEFLRLWPRLRVLARCTPADKYTIVTGELWVRMSGMVVGGWQRARGRGRLLTGGGERQARMGAAGQ